MVNIYVCVHYGYGFVVPFPYGVVRRGRPCLIDVLSLRYMFDKRVKTVLNSLCLTYVRIAGYGEEVRLLLSFHPHLPLLIIEHA